MKIEVESQIIIDLPYGITEESAHRMIEIIKKSLDKSEFCDLYDDIELDF